MISSYNFHRLLVNIIIVYSFNHAKKLKKAKMTKNVTRYMTHTKLIKLLVWPMMQV